MMAKADLSRALIVDRALELADAEGLAGITLRRLATEFGVTPMALYWHVANKDELLAAMGDRLFDDVVVEPADEWPDQLGAVVRGIVGALRRHPASAELAAPRVLQCTAGLDLAERTLTLLRDAGFGVQQAADIARTALQTAIMLVKDQPGGEHTVAAEERDAAIAKKRAAIAALPEAKYPRVLESAAALFECEDDVYFGFGTDLFVAGVRALSERLAAQSVG